MTADEFLQKAHDYQLGELTTERPHADSLNLSEYVKKDLPRAIEVLKKIDLDALDQLIEYQPMILGLEAKIQEVFQAGGRVFLCGCGATGRLAMTIEYLWREKNPGSEAVQAFMAGGDIALVHSLEGFEDFPEFGARHAIQKGFTENDLMIGITEGGETPYVIGATEHAAQVAHHSPYFIYCNPDQDLLKVERSRQVIENSKIEKICLATGSMAIAGSTRMQASTVMQLAVGAALLGTKEHDFAQLRDRFQNTDLQQIRSFIEQEASIYREGDYLLYTPYDFAITTFTDTTERSPTFSLPPFENPTQKDRPASLCYIMLPEAETGKDSWNQLLKREPTALNWLEADNRTGAEYLSQFDFGKNIQTVREDRLTPSRQWKFEIKKEGQKIHWQLKEHNAQFEVSNMPPLFEHTLLKMALNSHSTLLMGKLNRYHSNIMTWVTPTNCKLVDRSVRNIGYLLEQDGIQLSYEKIVYALFEKMESNQIDEPVVVRTYNHLKGISAC